MSIVAIIVVGYLNTMQRYITAIGLIKSLMFKIYTGDICGSYRQEQEVKGDSLGTVKIPRKHRRSWTYVMKEM